LFLFLKFPYFYSFVVCGLSSHFLQRNYATCKDESKQPNYFDFGVKVIPHPQKAYKGGEDAYFAQKNILAVADGVGGWADYGVDPALYSKELCSNIESLVKSDFNKYKKNPKQLLIDAAGRTKSKGSSTLCIVNLDQEKPTLYSSYIGDSGYIILRKVENKLRIVYQSQEQQRGFNFPYQTGTNGDPPSIALKFEHQIQNNDIVIVGTDGLFDNIDEKQIVDMVTPFIKESNIINPTQIAETIAQSAFKYSLDKNYQSPFATKAKQAYIYFKGGKSDDITVLVGQVKMVDEKI